MSDMERLAGIRTDIIHDNRLIISFFSLERETSEVFEEEAFIDKKVHIPTDRTDIQDSFLAL